MLEDVEGEGRDEHLDSQKAGVLGSKSAALTVGPAKARTGCAVCRHAQDNASSASKRVCGFFLCTAAIRRMSVTLFAHRVSMHRPRLRHACPAERHRSALPSMRIFFDGELACCLGSDMLAPRNGSALPSMRIFFDLEPPGG